MRRGSLRAAEEITGHKYETIGRWLRLWNYNGMVEAFSLRHRHLLRLALLEALRADVSERGV